MLLDREAQIASMDEVELVILGCVVKTLGLWSQSGTSYARTRKTNSNGTPRTAPDGCLLPATFPAKRRVQAGTRQRVIQRVIFGAATTTH
jgi:hypothetical protein